MTFYGNYDIMLGKFLMQYCFRRSYMCESCKMPMLEHIRRYVHSLGCVQVTITGGDQTTNQQSQSTVAAAAAEQILMTSWCTICEVWTPSVPISKDTWCMSFAKYLEHRFHSHAYRRRIVDMMADNNQHHQNTNAMNEFEHELSKRQCPHSMHKDHVQHFSFNGIVVSFVYSIVEPFEISLPAPILLLQIGGGGSGGDDGRTEDIKQFAQTGYEVFASIYDKMAMVCGDVGEYPMLAGLKQTLNSDQLAFRERVGAVQTLLIERPVNVTEVADAMLLMRKSLADHIDQWNLRLVDATAQARSLYSTSSVKAAPELPPVDAGTICTEDLRADSPTTNNVDDELDLNVPPQPKEVATSSSGDSSPVKCDVMPSTMLTATPTVVATKDNADKKSVKTLLREFLPSDKSVTPSCSIHSPLPPGEHLTLTVGQIPVLVRDKDLSSVIAYSLMSMEYNRELENMLSNYDKETTTMTSSSGGSDASGGGGTGMPPHFSSTPSPSAHRRSHDSTSAANADVDDNASASIGKEGSDKKIKSNHIEVNFQVNI